MICRARWLTTRPTAVRSPTTRKSRSGLPIYAPGSAEGRRDEEDVAAVVARRARGVGCIRRRQAEGRRRSEARRQAEGRSEGERRGEGEGRGQADVGNLDSRQSGLAKVARDRAVEELGDRRRGGSREFAQRSSRARRQGRVRSTAPLLRDPHGRREQLRLGQGNRRVGTWKFGTQ